MEASAAASVIKRWRKSTGGRGAGQIPLRLFVVAPTPYRKRKSSKLYYRQPAYLLTTDLRHSAPQLLQIYFDRWQIEVNHRDEKDTLGVGQAQLWNIDAVPKQPALVVAAYSALLLAALQAFGTERSARLIRPCPAGDARPTALPASTWSPCCAKKWSTTPKAPNLWASNSPTAPSPTPPTREKCRNSRPRPTAWVYRLFPGRALKGRSTKPPFRPLPEG